MPSLSPERLCIFALDALEEVIAEADFGPVRRTWALRLALAYLASLHPRTWSKSEPYRDFWRALSAEGKMNRVGALNAALRVIYVRADVERDQGRAEVIYERVRQLRLDQERL